MNLISKLKDRKLYKHKIIAGVQFRQTSNQNRLNLAANRVK